MTEALPAIIQAMGPVESNQGGQQVIGIQLKLSTGENYWVKLQPEHPLLTQITVGEHVLAVPTPHSEQQRFEIVTNYGSAQLTNEIEASTR